jgi:hypothetical protein
MDLLLVQMRLLGDKSNKLNFQETHINKYFKASLKRELFYDEKYSYSNIPTVIEFAKKRIIHVINKVACVILVHKAKFPLFHIVIG